ncbi:hypothetical protein PWT90_07567 [Aphanocladium album]|nr:hypothetical protein PWT90_07567 [Aphanocladium album]
MSNATEGNLWHAIWLQIPKRNAQSGNQDGTVERAGIDISFVYPAGMVHAEEGMGWLAHETRALNGVSEAAAAERPDEPGQVPVALDRGEGDQYKKEPEGVAGR